MTGFAEYERYDGIGLAELVAHREVAAAELVEAAIARVDARNPRLNAVTIPMFERARATAAGPLPAGPFAGVPFLVKDLLVAVAGVRLTSGSRFLADFVPDHDSELAVRHRRAGLVTVGRTNTPEFGIMGVTEPALHGATRNPWDLGRTPGGSSGGAAAAVAAGIVPMAHGGDGGGSIRIPAACCGVFGLKPTRGRVPLGPDFGEQWAGFVSDHAITRTVRDSAALLDATRGPELGAPYTAPPPARPFLTEVGADPGALRIAVTGESLFGERTHPECAAAVDSAAELCAALGHRVEAARPAFDKHVLRRAYLAVIAACTARAIAQAGEVTGRRPSAAGFETETWLLGLIGRAMDADEYLAHLDAIHAARVAVAHFFQGYDLLLTPTLAQPPLPIGALALTRAERAQVAVLRALRGKRLLNTALERMAAEAFEATGNTMIANLTGQPAMSVPLYWSAQGLPIGTQFIARFGEEAKLFRLAAQLEQARPWAERRPPGFADPP